MVEIVGFIGLVDINEQVSEKREAYSNSSVGACLQKLQEYVITAGEHVEACQSTGLEVYEVGVCELAADDVVGLAVGESEDGADVVDDIIHEGDVVKVERSLFHMSSHGHQQFRHLLVVLRSGPEIGGGHHADPVHFPLLSMHGHFHCLAISLTAHMHDHSKLFAYHLLTLHPSFNDFLPFKAAQAHTLPRSPVHEHSSDSLSNQTLSILLYLF